jgi:hypothetical protein
MPTNEVETLASILGISLDAAAAIKLHGKVALAHQSMASLIVLRKWDMVKALAEDIAAKADTLAKSESAGIG